jgi:hypothetical protein
MQEILMLFKAHMGEFVLGFALLVSEVLGSSEKFKSSSIFEFIVNLLKSKKAELEKK